MAFSTINMVFLCSEYGAKWLLAPFQCLTIGAKTLLAP